MIKTDRKEEIIHRSNTIMLKSNNIKVDLNYF